MARLVHTYIVIPYPFFFWGTQGNPPFSDAKKKTPCFSWFTLNGRPSQKKSWKKGGGTAFARLLRRKQAGEPRQAVAAEQLLLPTEIRSLGQGSTF